MTAKIRETLHHGVPGRRIRKNAVEAGGADAVDAARVFAELAEAACAPRGRGEMHVRELRDRVAERVVDLAEGAVAAVDVGDDEAGDVGGGRRGERLDAVAGDEHDVDPQLAERAGQ